MTPDQWSRALAAGAQQLFNDGQTELARALAAMAGVCREINAVDNPRSLPPELRETAALNILPAAGKPRMASLPTSHGPAGLTIDVPFGWRLVQVLRDEPTQSEILCVIEPVSEPLPY
jgi:hypothetical protein